MARFEALFGAIVLFFLWQMYVNFQDIRNGNDTYAHYLLEVQERQVRGAARQAWWAKCKARLRSIFPRVQKAVASIAANLSGG